MKTLIIEALDLAMEMAREKVNQQFPKTKKQLQSVDISDVGPIDIPAFMEKNNIPNDAYFSGVDNGYDGWHVDRLNLSWSIDVPTTEADKLRAIRQRFSNIAFPLVKDSLTSNGYKRVGFNSGLLKAFDGTTVYDMYVNKEFDRLVEYYSLYFSPL